MGNAGVTTARNCHRVALAVDDFEGAMRLWNDVFGFGTMQSSIVDELDGSLMGLVWAGNAPLLALATNKPDGTVGRYLDRYGPSVHSLAWEVDDMWASDRLLQQAGFRITGVHVEGRHFFMHPKDTFGLLLELTDDVLPLDPRHGPDQPEPVDGSVPARHIAWVTAAVHDLGAVSHKLEEVFGESIQLLPHRGEQHEVLGQVQLGDMLVRLAEPTSDASRYATSVDGTLGRFHSVALAVDHFDDIERHVSSAGLGIASRTDDSVWIEPADTQGIRFELVPAD